MTKERFQELLKPIADGLFGKQRTRYGEMPHYTVRPVGMISAASPRTSGPNMLSLASR